jgi:hypothetical protein
MIGDIQDAILEELGEIRRQLEVQNGKQQQVSVDVRDGERASESSPVFTTGEGGATITNQSFTSEGEFAFGFPSRVVYLRTEDAPIVVEFDGTNTPTRQIPVPASKGEITLGDGGAGFRAEKVNVKLARNASVNETTVHVIAYR